MKRAVFPASQEGRAFGSEPGPRKLDSQWTGCVGGCETWSLNGKVKVLTWPAGREGVEPLLEP